MCSVMPVLEDAARHRTSNRVAVEDSLSESLGVAVTHSAQLYVEAHIVAQPMLIVLPP